MDIDDAEDDDILEDIDIPQFDVCYIPRTVL